MRNIIYVSFVMLLLGSGLTSCRSLDASSQLAQSSANEVPLVFLLAGQSNMAGQTPLDDEMRRLSVNDVEIFCVHHYKFASDREEYRPEQERARWESLRPCGASEGQFGPELTFAQELRKKFPQRKIYLIKYAHGGTSLACEWQANPPSMVFASYGEKACINFFQNSNKPIDSLRTYERFLAATRWGLESLEARGIRGDLSGMLWFQGEADAEGRAAYPFLSQAYPENLAHFVSSLRRDLQRPQLPFVLGKIKCGWSSAEWDRSVNPLERVRQAQQSFADSSTRVYAFDSMDLTFQADNCHFDTESMKTIGRRFADSLRFL